MNRRNARQQAQSTSATRAQQDAGRLFTSPRTTRLPHAGYFAAQHTTDAILHANAADGGSGRLAYPADNSSTVARSDSGDDAARWRP